MEEENLKKIESKLWASAEKMRGAVSVSDYKFIVLGLIFLKYISDSFEEKTMKAKGVRLAAKEVQNIEIQSLQPKKAETTSEEK